MNRLKLFLEILLLVAASPCVFSQGERMGIACRINEEQSKRIFFLQLGDAIPAIAQGIFFPMSDEVVLFNGKRLGHYYRDTLRIEYYTPLRKQYYPSAPAGWCSWYAYHYDISTKKLMRAANVLHDSLQPYGLNIFQIDNGWQTTGSGDRPEVWTRANKYFPGGMGFLASELHKLHFMTGLWLVPQGTSDPVDTLQYGSALVRLEDGNWFDTEVASRLIDPTHAVGKKYLERIIDTVLRWGYTYLKFDTQPEVEKRYSEVNRLLATPNRSGAFYYRKSLEIMRERMGESVFLLGSWEPVGAYHGTGRGAPITGIGFLNALRVSWDSMPWEDTFNNQFNAIMRYYFLHNVATYIDPDAFYAGNSVSDNLALNWVTMLGMAGVVLMDGDKPDSLNAYRLELLRRIYPPADIAPMDLFQHTSRKKIWDLKISHLGRQYDVVAMFRNEWDYYKDFTLRAEELGWDASGEYHVYDFWNRTYLGKFRLPAMFDVPMKSCRVLTVMRAGDRPLLLSTSRHITQGPIDIRALHYDEKHFVYSGESAVVGSEDYQMRFVVPDSAWSLKEIRGVSRENIVVEHEGDFYAITFQKPMKSSIQWEVHFARSNNGNAGGGDSSATTNSVSWKTPQIISVRYFPTPCSESATITFIARFNDDAFITTATGMIRLFDLFGRKVYESESLFISNGKNRFSLDTRNLPSGMYVAQIHVGKAMNTHVLNVVH